MSAAKRITDAAGGYDRSQSYQDKGAVNIIPHPAPGLTHRFGRLRNKIKAQVRYAVDQGITEYQDKKYYDNDGGATTEDEH
jgi:hypothetical protein